MKARINHQELPAGYLQSLLQLQKPLDQSGLELPLLELIRTRVSMINGCAYCLDMHSKDAVHAGESLQRLITLPAWREAPYYTAREQAALAFAERLTRMPEEEHNADIHDELTLHFSKDEIAYLTLAVIQINAWNRFVKSFGPVPGTYQVPQKQEVQ